MVNPIRACIKFWRGEYGLNCTFWPIFVLDTVLLFPFYKAPAVFYTFDSLGWLTYSEWWRLGVLISVAPFLIINFAWSKGVYTAAKNKNILTGKVLWPCLAVMISLSLALFSFWHALSYYAAVGLYLMFGWIIHVAIVKHNNRTQNGRKEYIAASQIFIVNGRFRES